MGILDSQKILICAISGSVRKFKNTGYMREDFGEYGSLIVDMFILPNGSVSQMVPPFHRLLPSSISESQIYAPYCFSNCF